MVNIYHRAEYVNTFNPQLLVMSGKFHVRPWLLDLGGLITKIGSFMIMAEIEPVSIIMWFVNYFKHSDEIKCIYFTERTDSGGACSSEASGGAMVENKQTARFPHGYTRLFIRTGLASPHPVFGTRSHVAQHSAFGIQVQLGPLSSSRPSQLLSNDSVSYK